MAREGINKQLVQKAKLALLAQGKRPTINAVRNALGNTGSKTTISHYLKELEEKPQATLDRLTEPLAQLVHGLSEQLQIEANEQLIRAQAQFSQEKSQLQSQLEAMQKHVDGQQHNLDALSARLLTEQQQRQAETAQTKHLTTELSLAQQRIKELNIRLQEQHTQIEIHNIEQQHASDALEQYRQAHQELHDTLLQQHAQQVAQLTIELQRNFNTLTTTQQELIELHRKNARLQEKLDAISS